MLSNDRADRMKLLIADDHPLYRDALRGSLILSFDELEILESEDLDSTIHTIQQHHDIDLLLLDLNMPGSCDLFGLIRIRKLFADLPVAVVSGMTDSYIVNKAINAGAQGFITKTSTAKVIADAIDSILAGEICIPENMPAGTDDINPEFEQLSLQVSSLTPAQYKVLCQLKSGLLNKQIAYELNISEATVKAHITAIFKKLEINNRSQAVLIASQLQLTV